VVICGAAAFAQAPAPAPTDRTRAPQFSAAVLQSALAKLPADRAAGSVRVFSLDPYNVAVEQRQPRAQGASLHEAQAELFFVIDGSATMITGGTIADGKRNGTNIQGTTIDGGTRTVFNKVAFIRVQGGVPHELDVNSPPGLVRSLYVPITK
jgi:hypothetical protein